MFWNLAKVATNKKFYIQGKINTTTPSLMLKIILHTTNVSLNIAQPSHPENCQSTSFLDEMFVKAGKNVKFSDNVQKFENLI